MKALQVLGRTALGIALAALPGCFFDLSPDGSRLVFMAPTEEDSGLAIIGTDGKSKTLRRLPRRTDGISSTPAWSPDGKQILFVQTGGGSNKLLLFDIASRRTRTLLSGAPITAISWRSDGRRCVAIWQLDTFNREAAFVELPSRRVLRRVPLKMRDISGPIVWAGRGDDIILKSDAPFADLYLLSGRSARPLTNISRVAGVGLGQSGKSLIVASSEPFKRPVSLQMFALSLADRKLKALPFPSRIPVARPDKAAAIIELSDIVFSPDGRRCVLILKFGAGHEAKTREEQKYFAFYAMARDGSQPRLLGRTGLFTRETDNHMPLVLYSVAWSRDGRRIGVFASDVEHGQSFTICDADGRNARRVPIPAFSASTASPKAQRLEP